MKTYKTSTADTRARYQRLSYSTGSLSRLAHFLPFTRDVAFVNAIPEKALPIQSGVNTFIKRK